MGKKKRNKPNSPKPAKIDKKIAPDEYYSYGPIELARFGKHIVQRNNMDKETHQKFLEVAAARYPEVCSEIDQKIAQIVNLVKHLPARAIMRMAYWEMAVNHLYEGEAQHESKEEMLSLRMVDYLQSIIASVDCNPGTPNENVTESDWDLLKTLVEQLFHQLNGEFHFCRSAYRTEQEQWSEGFDEYYFRAQLHWVNVRGDRPSIHQIPYFKKLLSPHEDVFRELFDIGVNDFLREIERIMHSLTRGLEDVAADMKEFQADTVSRLEEKIGIGSEYPSERDLQELMADVIAENKWEQRSECIFGRFSGMDLFDLSKITNLPENLLNELSWGVGENTSFFKDGDFKGWPLRVWPVFERPFIKIEDLHYCFDLNSLFDHLYRTLQKIIIRLKPSYSTEWKERQTEVTETLPLELLQKILPKSHPFRSVYYGCKGKRKEVDGLLLCDDHLFVIEVKGGAFTHTSPAVDFDSYIASLKNLVLKPAKQGRRFLEHLESQGSIDLYDSKGTKLHHLNAQDWSHKTICAITLDPFTELAAQIQHLKKIDIDVGEAPIWSLSLSDLFVYADIFLNPLIFLHYVEQRNLAFHSTLLQLDDELDHVGLYFEHNAYAQYAKEMAGRVEKAQFTGYRSEIDKFYAERIIDPDAQFTQQQDQPIRMREIISFLAESNVPKRRLIASTLLDCSSEWRDKISTGIENMLLKQRSITRAQPLMISGESLNLTFFCWQDGSIFSDPVLVKDHVYASMLVTGESERLLIELFFDRNDHLINICADLFRKANIPESDVHRLEQQAEILRKKRVQKVIAHNGKIGRNEPCPCGSGKKYKRCCGQEA